MGILNAFLVAVAMAVSVTAAPAPTSETTFSFAQWVEDIISHPDTALTPEEAISAAAAAAVVISAGRLDEEGLAPRRARNAPAGDAAAYLDYLARKGAQGINCAIGQNQYVIQMCHIRGAQLVGTKPAARRPGSGNDVARTGGLIFDTRWRSDNTAKGSKNCITNNQFQVNISGV